MRRKGLITHLYIWNASSGICCWETNGTCAIVIFTLPLPANGRTSLIWQKLGRQDKLRTSSGQVQDKVHTDNPDIERLVAVIGKDQMSVKMMMEKLQLKGRDNFLRLYLFPALEEGFVTLLYPDKPRHPRQKYLLTVKGLALLSEL